MTKSLTISEQVRAAEELTAQYGKAISGTREILVFGAMMIQLGNALEINVTTDADGHIATREGGLKGWIETHCPEINYKTAHSFYSLARGLYETLELPRTVDLSRLLLADTAELNGRDASAKQKIEAAISGKTKTQLQWDFGIRKVRGIPGAPVGNQNARKDLRGVDPEEQRENLKRVVDGEMGKAMTEMGRLIDSRRIVIVGLPTMRMIAEELERLAKSCRAVLKETAEHNRI
jgi:hypothetical protein